METLKLATNIKKLCKQNNFPINALIMRCELSKSFIYDLEKRKAMPSIDKIEKIAKVFHCSIDFLLGRTPFTDEQNKIICDNISPYLGESFTAKETNGVILNFEGQQFVDIKQGTYKFNYESLFYVATLLEIPVEILTQGTGIGVHKILPEESDYRIAAWGAKQTHGDDQPPIDENKLR